MKIFSKSYVFFNYIYRTFNINCFSSGQKNIFLKELLRLQKLSNFIPLPRRLPQCNRGQAGKEIGINCQNNSQEFLNYSD